MAIVDIKQIKLSYPDAAHRIRPELLAMGPVDDEGARTTLCDPAWGYFLFTQSTGFIYNEAQTYLDVTEFSITGVFTRGAQGCGEGSAHDTAAFNAIVAKYEALEKLFIDASQAQMPADPRLWGAAGDPRMIVLPEPLRDSKGERVFGMPGALEVEKSQFPNLLQYRATLSEFKPPAGKLKVNNTILDEAVLTINPPAPIFQQHAMVGAKGALIQVRNYQVLSISIQGSLPYIAEPAAPLPSGIRTFITDLDDSRMTVNVISGRQEKELWKDMAAEQPEIDIDYRQQQVQVSVRGRQ